jgi:Na+/H+-dicarboxylate symporter
VPDPGVSTNLKTSGLTLKEFVTHLVPRSVVEAMATNEILQIVVFAIFAGVAISSLGERAKQLVEVIEQVAHMMLEVTGYVMKAAPFAVFAAIAATVTTNGLGIIVTFGKFMGGFYLSLAVLWAVIFAAGFLVIGPSCGSRSCSHFRPRARRPPTPRPSNASSSSACPTGSRASSCHWGIRSTSTAR